MEETEECVIAVTGQASPTADAGLVMRKMSGVIKGALTHLVYFFGQSKVNKL